MKKIIQARKHRTGVPEYKIPLETFNLKPQEETLSVIEVYHILPPSSVLDPVDAEQKVFIGNFLFLMREVIGSLPPYYPITNIVIASFTEGYIEVSNGNLLFGRTLVQELTVR